MYYKLYYFEFSVLLTSICNKYKIELGFELKLVQSMAMCLKTLENILYWPRDDLIHICQDLNIPDKNTSIKL